MADTQHFCLRWNNYQSSITSAFENLRDDEDFVDVTLACDGRSLKAHRVVLSACSPYFRELLKSTPCKHPVIVLQDVAFTDLHALVEFIYHGEVNVHQRSLSSFLKTAEVLRVSGLTQQQAEETHNLAQVQSLASTERNGGRTPANHHQSFADKLVEDALFPQTLVGPSPPPHLNNLPAQLLRRAAAAAAIRRERINSSQSDEISSKRHRSSGDSAGVLGNNNNPDVLNHMPQITATDFSTIKHNNNLSPHIKDSERHMLNKTPIGINNNIISNNNNTINSSNPDNHNTIATTTNGGGSLGSSTDKESLTPSPPARTSDDVKCEPMELVCGSNIDPDHSNDSIDDHHDHHHDHGNLSGNGNEGKGSLRIKNFSLPHEDDMDNSIHSHTAQPFLMPPDGKLFSSPGSFNFSMAALAADSAALAGNHWGFNSQALAQAAEMAGSPQGQLTTPTSTQSTTPTYPSPQPYYSSTTTAQLLSATGADSEDFRCDPCNKNLSSLTRLKRHIQNVHMRPTKEPVCNICKRVYSSLNSLRNHKSIYHRNHKQQQIRDETQSPLGPSNLPFFPINHRMKNE